MRNVKGLDAIVSATEYMSQKKTGAVVLVVSEESDDISIAEKGKLTRFDYINKLRAKLERVLVR